MIAPVNGGTGPVDGPVSAPVAAGRQPVRGGAAGVPLDATPAKRLALLGPPIDVTRVNEIRAAIASGEYTVDADRLAAAMLALDLPAAKA